MKPISKRDFLGAAVFLAALCAQAPGQPPQRETKNFLPEVIPDEFLEQPLSADSAQTDPLANGKYLGDVAEVSEEVFLNHESSRFRVIMPLEGDVYHTPNVELVVALGPEAFASVSILINGEPLDRAAETQGRLLQVTSPALPQGIHQVSVLFLDEAGKMIYGRDINFYIQLPKPERVRSRQKFSQSGVLFARSEFRGKSRINQIEGYRPFKIKNGTLVRGKREDAFLPNATNVLHTTYRVKQERLELQSRVSLNAGESKYRQPLHRFGGRVQYGPWLNLAGGDIYPAMNELVMKDTRVRGGEAQMRVVARGTEWGSFHYAQGQIKRQVDPHVLIYESGQGNIQDTLPGTYGRHLAAGRLALGARDQMLSLGITGLKTWDVTPDWDSLYFAHLPHFSPEENIVSGVDLQAAFWQRRIVLYADYALSLWTANRDAAILGSEDSRFNLHTSGVTPEDLENFMVINASTLIDPEDVTRNHALQAGVRASLPLTSLGSESEIMVYETGDYYRSEGNPFITTNGERGIKILQRVKLLENKMAAGAEGKFGRRDLYDLDTSSNSQMLVYYKGDIRYSPHITLPSIWIGVSGNHLYPDNTGPTLSPKSAFTTQSLYLGGYQQLRAGPGKLYLALNYTVTNYLSKVYPSGLSGTASPDTFESSTHVLSSTLQFRRPVSPLLPFMKYTLTSNSIREPIHNVSLGTSLALLNILSGQFSFDVGQYPISSQENDRKLGQSLSLNYAFRQNHSLGLQERIFWNGTEPDYQIGASYEMYF